MQEYTKNVKRKIRELAGLLYERELNEEIIKLDEHFEVWRKGELSPFDLAEKIHHFHQHPARELYALPVTTMALKMYWWPGTTSR
ncbi:MAG: hypothetical protein IPM82_18440 [Saprospiraceae bacterium]|nr:hypothetical protein [Saprospiraceae bacterium]